MTYLNPAERQSFWEGRIRGHGESCPTCAEDETECETWQRLIRHYNTAAPPAADDEPEET